MRGASGEPAPVLPCKTREGGLGPDFHCPRSRTRLKPTLQSPELVCRMSSLPPPRLWESFLFCNHPTRPEEVVKFNG